MDLSAEEVRVLGCLVEKERTTPDQYPLTTNALRTACNQKTNRDPVVDYLERTVDQAMLSLRDRHLARTVLGGGRAAKHRHVLHEAWALDEAETAVLGVLALRGPQTPGELRARTERMTPFATPEDVVAVLEALAARDVPLVVQLGRRAGQKEDRWAHLLSDELEPVAAAEPASWAPPTARPEPASWPVPAPSGDGPPRAPGLRSVPDQPEAWSDHDRPDHDRPDHDRPDHDRPDHDRPEQDGAASALADRVAELESEAGALREELEALRDRVDRLDDLLGD